MVSGPSSVIVISSSLMHRSCHQPTRRVCCPGVPVRSGRHRSPLAPGVACGPVTDASTVPASPAERPPRGLADLVVAAFVGLLLIANVAATKLIELGPVVSVGTVQILPLITDGGALLFPLTYILGDVLAEVYGLRQARRAIVLGFAMAALMSVTFLIVGAAPPASDWALQDAWTAVLGFVPRIVVASLLAYLLGQLLNAWVLVRIPFPGRRLADSLVDLPFALPTAVAGISLTALLAGNGWIGQHLEPLGIKLAFTPSGVVIALIFVGLPFVVRTVQPVLEDAEKELEEAATSLGASRWQIFTKVILPSITPALLTGFAMAFARAIGEYGSVIFIAGNVPMVSEITPLIIIGKLEQYDFAGATAVAVVMLVIAFVMLLVINLLQAWQRRHAGMPA